MFMLGTDCRAGRTLAVLGWFCSCASAVYARYDLSPQVLARSCSVASMSALWRRCQYRTRRQRVTYHAAHACITPTCCSEWNVIGAIWKLRQYSPLRFALALRGTLRLLVCARLGGDLSADHFIHTLHHTTLLSARQEKCPVNAFSSKILS